MRRRLARWLGIASLLGLLGGLGYVLLSNGSPAAANSHLGLSGTGQGAGIPRVDGAAIVAIGLKFGLVVLLLGVSLWLLRRYAGAQARKTGPSKAIQIVETIPLAQHRTLYVLDLGDRAVVIGATQQQFTALADVVDPTVLERLRAKPERRVAALPVSYDRLVGRLPVRLATLIGSRRQAAAQSESVPIAAVPAVPRRGVEVDASSTPASVPGKADGQLAVAARSAPPVSETVTPEVASHLRALAERLRAGERLG